MSLNAVDGTPANRRPRTGSSVPSGVTFTASSMIGPAWPPATSPGRQSRARCSRTACPGPSAARGTSSSAPPPESPARFSSETRRPGRCRPAVAVGLQEILLRRPARQQRQQPPLLDQRDVLRRHAFVVHEVRAGDGRPSNCLSEACRSRKTNRTAPAGRCATETASSALPCASRGFSASGGRRASISGASVCRSSSALACPSTRIGPVNSSPSGADRRAFVRAGQLGGALQQLRHRRQIFETVFDAANTSRTVMPSSACASAEIRRYASRPA